MFDMLYILYAKKLVQYSNGQLLMNGKIEKNL